MVDLLDAPLVHSTVSRLIIDCNRDLAANVHEALRADDPLLNIGWNQPYAALTGVTLTLEKHGDGRGIESVMIELRNDEILEPAGVEFWSARLARCLETARKAPRDAGLVTSASTQTDR